MKRLMVFPLMLTLILLPTLAAAKAGTFTTFDPPGSIFTYPNGINPSGTIAGSYVDADEVSHGFLRAPDGSFTTFDAPGAAEPGAAGQGTFAYGINPAGTITGNYYAANNVSHGFLRSRRGTFTTFDPPGSIFTFARGINPSGAIMGVYQDESGVHGFLRAPDGAFASFDVPGEIVLGDLSGVINPAGAITLSYIGADEFHPFLRTADGNLVTFDVPAAAGQSTFASGIDPTGAITGYYYSDAALNGAHGFLRSRRGTFTAVDAPGAIYTFPNSINDVGAIAGSYIDESFVYHGFLRARDGAYTTFEAPEGSFYIVPSSINSVGAITGAYPDASGSHGFLWIPCRPL